MTASFIIFANNNVELNVDDLYNTFWQVNAERLSNYFTKLDFPYLTTHNSSNIENTLWIDFDKYPDGFAPDLSKFVELDQIAPSGYPWIFSISNNIEIEKIAEEWSDEIFKQLYNYVKNKEYYEHLRNKFLENRTIYHCDFKKLEVNPALSLLILFYIVAQKVNGIVNCMELIYYPNPYDEPKISPTDIRDKVFEAEEFFDIIKELIKKWG